MEGRLILVHLMCKDVASSLGQSIFTPCVAFRVAGTPSPRSVSFGAAVNNNNGLIGIGTNQPGPNSSSGLSASEYVAIAVCSVLLGLIYVASVLMYLHVRRRRRRENAATKRNLSKGGVLTGPEEGLIKSNPLLAARHHREAAGVGYLSDSGSCCSVESADPRGSDEAEPVSDDSTSHGQNVNQLVETFVVRMKNDKSFPG